MFDVFEELIDHHKEKLVVYGLLFLAGFAVACFTNAGLIFGLNVVYGNNVNPVTVLLYEGVAGGISFAAGAFITVEVTRRKHR